MSKKQTPIKIGLLNTVIKRADNTRVRINLSVPNKEIVLKVPTDYTQEDIDVCLLGVNFFLQEHVETVIVRNYEGELYISPQPSIRVKVKNKKTGEKLISEYR